MIVLCATAAVNVQMLIGYEWLVEPHHLEVQSRLWGAACVVGAYAVNSFDANLPMDARFL